MRFDVHTQPIYGLFDHPHRLHVSQSHLTSCTSAWVTYIQLLFDDSATAAVSQMSYAPPVPSPSLTGIPSSLPSPPLTEYSIEFIQMSWVLFRSTLQAVNVTS